MTGRAIHISDLHRRAGHPTAGAVDDALFVLCTQLQPDVVIATGDLGHRGRRVELESAKALLDRLPARAIAVPGNHDLPYGIPARFTRPGRLFRDVVGPTEVVEHTASFSICALDSSWAWRQQGGRLRAESIARVNELTRAAPGALRIVAFHHHVAAAPWRGVHKLPLARRERALAAFGSSGVELVLGGHIHQATVCERRELEAGAAAMQTMVLATAPGFGRPRPHRLGEAQGLQVVSWDGDTIAIETRVWDGASFIASALRTFPRGTLAR